MTLLLVAACSDGRPDPTTDLTDDTGTGCVAGPEVVGNGLDDDCDGFGDEFGETSRLVTEGAVALAGREGVRLGTTLSSGVDAQGQTWLVAGSASTEQWVYAAQVPAGLVMVLRAPANQPYDLFGDAVAVGAFDGEVDAPVVVSDPLDSYVGLFGPLSGHEEGLQGSLVPWTEETRYGELGTALKTGDVDLDGFDELIVSAPSNPYGFDEFGDVLVLDGPVTRPTWQTERLHIYYTFPPTQNLGQGFCDVVDLTGDGLPEIGISSEEDGGRIWMIPGDTTGVASVPDVQVASLAGESPNDDTGKKDCSAGDANGDGHQDLLLGAPLIGMAYLALGPFDGQRSLADADARVVGDWEGDWCGYGVAFLLGEDGEDHPVVSCSNGVDRVAVYRGSTSSGTMGAADAAVIFVGASPGEGTGSAIAGRHDLTGDGVPDLAITVPVDSTQAPDGGVVYLFEGPLL